VEEQTHTLAAAAAATTTAVAAFAELPHYCSCTLHCTYSPASHQSTLSDNFYPLLQNPGPHSRAVDKSHARVCSLKNTLQELSRVLGGFPFPFREAFQILRLCFAALFSLAPIPLPSGLGFCLACLHKAQAHFSLTPLSPILVTNLTLT
jgi:hypothetical protein